MYMESDMTPRAWFNILRSTYEEDGGEYQHGHTLGGRFKALALHAGQFYRTHTFKEPRVDALLNGLARSFSCRYGSYLGDHLTEEERRNQRQDLKTLGTLDHTFQALLGEESSWKYPMKPEVQAVDPGISVSRVRETTTGCNLRMRGLWPNRAQNARAWSAGCSGITFFPPHNGCLLWAQRYHLSSAV